MSYQRILTIQDISCFGQCSLTVALPILSACGAETCILPSAVLSTHTAGFSDYTFTDLTADIPKIANHWRKENISFDAVYTGYLGSTEQIDYVKNIGETLLNQKGLFLVDPAMADNGKLYPAFDANYVEKMKELAFSADVMLPNITEACLLADFQYQTEYDEAYIDRLLARLQEHGAKTVILTGVGYSPDKTGVVVFENGEKRYYEHKRIARICHGTGDVYASAFVGALTKGKSAYDAAKLAADYTVACIEATADDANHWYGVKFELVLPQLIEMLK